jgi:branched-chain amino acid transport system ATP-binding protein
VNDQATPEGTTLNQARDDKGVALQGAFKYRPEFGAGNALAVTAFVLERMYSYFPRLAEMRGKQAGYCSGGEQQMLAISRALMAHPTMLLLDEPSLGLAPMLVKEIFERVKVINRETNLTVLVVEQNANVALTHADYGYIMESGRVVLEGTASELKDNPDVKEFYLGVTEAGGRKSYREVKSYKRRKRWM